MASLGSLVVSLAVDTARFQGDLGRAAHLAEARMRNIKDTASKALGAVTIYATAAGAALTVALKGAIDRAADLDDLAQSAGVTVEQLSRLGYAAKLSGTDLDIVGKALAKLSAGGAVDANRALMDLADQFASMPDGAIKTAMAVERFGERIGPQLIPLLNQGSIGLRRMADESDRLGATIANSTAKAAAEFNDRLDELRAAMGGLVNQLAADMLPLMVDLATEFKKTATNADSMAGTAEKVRTFFNVITTAAYTSYKVLEQFALMLAAVARMATQFDFSGYAAAAARGPTGMFQAMLSANGEIIAQLDYDMKAATQKGDEFLSNLWRQRTEAERLLTGSGLPPGGRNRRQFVSMFNPAGEDEDKKKTKPVDPMDGLGEIGVYSREMFNFANAQAEAFASFNDTANESLRRNVQDLSNDTTRMLGDMTVEYEKATDKWTAFATQAASNITDAFAQFLFDPFKDGLRGMAASFIDTIRQMLAQYLALQAITGIGGALSKSGNSFLQGVGGFLQGARAIGGPVAAGGAYLVGERGPEVLKMGNASGTIIPNNALAAAGGNVTMNYTIDARGADADRVMAIMPGLLRQTEQRTVARVQELLQRGRLA